MMEDKDLEEYNKNTWELRWNKKFIYPKSQREIVMGRRHYAVDNQKLPSVTTILSKTQTKEKQESSEVTLWYPDLYAGATDVVGIYNGRESIIDFKQTNKPKRREWIEDYFIQLAAYAMAHNYTYQTQIHSGVVLMCSKDGYFQKFEIADEEFRQYMYKWLARVGQYYANLE
jgi:hypothetical protein